jgi:phospholipid-binding lipoprotein MlaA
MKNCLHELTVASVFVLFLVALMAHGCASAPVQRQGEIPAKRPVSEIVKPDVQYVIDAFDPWEGMNRRIYKFNALFDKYLFLPVVSAYEWITPDFVQTGVSNFFNNLHEIKPLSNALLQFKMAKFEMTLSRIVINTTIGMGGLLDVATLEIPRQDEDFGQTLGFYGLGPGPYLVIPVLGPSTLRDTGGLVLDAAAYDAMIDEIMDELDMDSNDDEDRLKAGLTVLDGIDTRHQQGFRYYATGSPFEYDLIRRLYLEAREFQVAH